LSDLRAADHVGSPSNVSSSTSIADDEAGIRVEADVVASCENAAEDRAGRRASK
jgi:hypothetical protein